MEKVTAAKNIHRFPNHKLWMNKNVQNLLKAPGGALFGCTSENNRPSSTLSEPLRGSLAHSSHNEKRSTECVAALEL